MMELWRILGWKHFVLKVVMENLKEERQLGKNYVFSGSFHGMPMQITHATQEVVSMQQSLGSVAPRVAPHPPAAHQRHPRKGDAFFPTELQGRLVHQETPK